MLHNCPSHLSVGSRGLWATLTASFEFEAHEVELLRLALEALDRAAQARRALRRDGVFVLDRFDQLRPHPAVDIEAKSRRAYAALMAQLDLPEAEAPAPARLRSA
ncbi:hypothetical protein FSW04_09875 [Baekduia soli]|uniref:Uncharacterized protein n=1 Tax=Baekduia soli TaxID=496014 RepID=A0A5B8U4F0_9ACTN|nr:hypothetical protein [Baekduia soli]QEC47847.1 hypothetical protein FSW04_09875 [Baekduia soli]